ncbi:MAG: bifunctional phosphoribosylaminoimidazolecarboxamide formyltransferase/IMP cyclohydrolase [Phycisphaerales bacterium]
MTHTINADGLVRVRRALLSVSDKAGIVEFARGLASFGVELVSTGGTAQLLRDNGLDVRDVSDLTGFPEMMDGRVKTLHPKVHGGLLGVEHDPAHRASMEEHGIAPIDLVCIDLYPFTSAPDDATREELIELIDIGGPAMLRSAAKNHERVTVVPHADERSAVLDELRAHDGRTTHALRARLAARTFAITSAYDGAIARRLGDASGLRYGENPHQNASIVATASGHPMALSGADVLHGKALSYNNYNDASGAVTLAWELHRLDPRNACAVVVKHTNPCGAAVARDARSAIDGALAGDPLAAYGGILATNTFIDGDSVTPLLAKSVFLEVIVARGFTDEALEALRAKSANVRLLSIGAFPNEAVPTQMLRSLIGGDLLVQDADIVPIDASAWAHAAGPKVDDETLRGCGAVWAFAKHLSSNAIAIGGRDPEHPGVVRLFGAGAGQMDRVASCRLAVEKAGGLARGAIAASDAFFPFSDGPGVLIGAGVRVLVHPGGSKRDDETFGLCEERGVTCLTTGVRHFRH